MSDREYSVSETLGAVVVELLRLAAARWAAGDEHAAARLCAGAWRLVGDGELIDGESEHR